MKLYLLDIDMNFNVSKLKSSNSDLSSCYFTVDKKISSLKITIMSLVKRSNWLSPFSNSFLTEFFNTDNLLKNDLLPVERIPAVNVIETEKFYKLEIAVPGMKKEDFHVEIVNGMLSISAEKKVEKEEKEKNYTRREFSCESFSRMFSLPEDIKEGNIEAEYKNGILYLEVPKKEIKAVEKRNVVIK